MKTSRRFVLTLAAVVSLPMMAFACLWDYDTLTQERGRFPSTLELITGKFLRHSPEFYEWRIEDRLKKLEKDPNNLNYHDDLAVAYSKIGNFDKAIEVIQRKEKIQPGLYETYSNLGTFYILAGRFKEGLPYIDKALAINPDAHFGREKYQKYLVEDVLKSMDEGKLQFPAFGFVEVRSKFFFSPGRHLKNEFPGNQEFRSGAIKGVLGMMRFADYKNPLLLEALGNLLWDDDDLSDAKIIAARAYLQASYQMRDEAQRQAYRKLATRALEMQTGPRIEEIELEFQKELAEAERWYQELRAKEIGWITAGLNADEEFDKLYSQEPLIEGEIWEPGRKNWTQYFGGIRPDRVILASFLCLLFFVLPALLLCRFTYRRIRRWRAKLPG